MESKFLDTAANFGGTIFLMVGCGIIVYKLGTLFLNKHFDHIKNVTEEHNKRIDLLIKSHQDERQEWGLRTNEVVSRFSSSVDQLKDQISDIIHWTQNKTDIFKAKRN